MGGDKMKQRLPAWLTFFLIALYAFAESQVSVQIENLTWVEAEKTPAAWA